jgi:hypothetical protein
MADSNSASFSVSIAVYGLISAPPVSAALYITRAFLFEIKARGTEREYPGTGMAAVKIAVENALAPDRTNWLER